MALVACSECSKEVSTQARACPHCGAKRAKSAGPIAYIFAGLFFLIVFKSCSIERRADTRTSDQIAAANAAEKDYQARLVSAATVMASIKASLRDPQSVQWSSVKSDAEGTVVCVEYRARNGFGGMNVESASFG